MTQTDQLIEVPQPVRDAVASLMDAVLGAGYLGASVAIEQHAQDNVTVDLVLRPHPQPETITIEVVRQAVTDGLAALDAHTADLVLARTAITPGRRYWTCARFGHSIDPRDFVHTDGPCTDDTGNPATIVKRTDS